MITEHALAQSYVANLAMGATARDDLAYHETEYGASDGMVYFIGIGRPYVTHVKVGYTGQNPVARLRGLQTGCPFKMQLLGYVLGNQSMEKELHAVLSEERCEGEWFSFSEYAESTITKVLNAQVEM